MFDILKEEHQKAILIAVDTGTYDVDYSLSELKQLAESCAIDIEFTLTQKREKPDTATYIGSGKLEEAKQVMAAMDIDLAICDTELTAAQFRNIEELLDLPVIDRTTVILDIFAQRAVSREGSIQVELAQQKYRLPRLSGMGKSLSRLGGGIGTRGPGESKLESDRRHIQRRIHALEEELETIKAQRNRTTDRRKKNEIPMVALAGYTNAGKSTLLNTITGSDVYSEDQLFATLDPTARRFTLPEGTQAVMIDTVGFLQRIPHHLIEAFKSTLQHLSDADCILHVVDGSDENQLSHMEVTREMLSSLGCENVPVITVFNKSDKMDESIAKSSSEDKIYVSAITGEGIDSLLDAICDKLGLSTVNASFLFPYSCGKEVAKLHMDAISYEDVYEEQGTRVNALVRKETYHFFSDFLDE